MTVPGRYENLLLYTEDPVYSKIVVKKRKRVLQLRFSCECFEIHDQLLFQKHNYNETPLTTLIAFNTLLTGDHQKSSIHFIRGIIRRSATYDTNAGKL